MKPRTCLIHIAALAVARWQKRTEKEERFSP